MIPTITSRPSITNPLTPTAHKFPFRSMPRAAKPTPADPVPPPAPVTPEDAQEDAQHRRVLALLVDLGAALAQEIAQSPEPAAPRAEAFERVSRATRRAILVARHVAQQIAQRAAASPAPTPTLTPAQRRTAARARLIREVQDTIQTKARPADADALRAELIDRLDSPELDADLLARPVADLIADFLRDLGLAHPPGARPIGRRTPADIAHLNLLAALPPGQAKLHAPPPKPRPKPAPPPAPPPPPKRSWRDKPRLDPDPDTGIRPDSLLASLLKTTER